MTPMNQPVSNAVIRITALNIQVSLVGIEAIQYTDVGGSYNFDLVEGDHMIEINCNDEYFITGKVRVTSGIPATLTLPELLTGYPLP